MYVFLALFGSMNELHSVCRFAPTESGADWCRQRVDRVGVLFQLNWQTARTVAARLWVACGRYLCVCK